MRGAYYVFMHVAPICATLVPRAEMVRKEMEAEMMFTQKPEHRDFVVREAVSVYDREGILMVVPQHVNDGSAMETARMRVQFFGLTVIHEDAATKSMVVR